MHPIYFDDPNAHLKINLQKRIIISSNEFFISVQNTPNIAGQYQKDEPNCSESKESEQC